MVVLHCHLHSRNVCESVTMKVTRIEVAVSASTVTGALLGLSRHATLEKIGGVLFLASFIIGVYLVHKKAKAEKKTVFYP